MPLSFRLHKELAKEHGGEKRWGYRSISCGQLDVKGRRVGEATAQGRGSPTQLNAVHDEAKERVSLKKRSKESYKSLQAAGVPDDLDWFVDSNIQCYDSMGTPENTAQVHPYQFTTSMAELAQEKGVDIILGTVTSINYKDNENDKCPPPKAVESITYTPKTTTSPNQQSPSTSLTLPATDVVLAAGPWTRSLLPTAPISALRAHSITIRPTRSCSPYAIFTSISLPPRFRPSSKNTRNLNVTPEIYARPNNELYACGEGDSLIPLPPSTAEVEVDLSRCQDIADYCSSISDELRDGEITTRQACYLPQVESEVGSGPLVGKAAEAEGLYVAAGHTCWGIQNGPGTGKLMSEFVFGGERGKYEGGGLDPRRFGV